MEIVTLAGSGGSRVVPACRVCRTLGTDLVDAGRVLLALVVVFSGEAYHFEVAQGAFLQAHVGYVEI